MRPCLLLASLWLSACQTGSPESTASAADAARHVPPPGPALDDCEPMAHPRALVTFAADAVLVDGDPAARTSDGPDAAFRAVYDQLLVSAEQGARSVDLLIERPVTPGFRAAVLRACTRSGLPTYEVGHHAETLELCRRPLTGG